MTANSSEKNEDLPSLKKSLSRSLPEKIASVMHSYDDFAAAGAPPSAKEFTAHHAACKAALAHAEMLLKIAKWSEVETTLSPSATPAEDTLLQQAKRALSTPDSDYNFLFEDDENEDETTAESEA